MFILFLKSHAMADGVSDFLPVIFQLSTKPVDLGVHNQLKINKVNLTNIITPE